MDAHKLQQQKQTQQQQLIQLEQQTLDWQERQSELALAYEAEQAQDEQHLKLENLSEEVHTLDEQYAVMQEQFSTTQAQGREQYAAQQSLSAKLPQLQAATQTALLQQQEALLGAKRFHQNLEERQADLAALEALAAESASLNALSDDIGNLAQKIQALGAVNLAPRLKNCKKPASATAITAIRATTYNPPSPYSKKPSPKSTAKPKRALKKLLKP